MAKKYFGIILITVLVLSCSVCLEDKEFINGIRIENENKVKINWNGRNYEFFGTLSFTLIPIHGKQIGIIDNDPKDKITSVKGYSSEEWIINYYDVIMTTYDLYKEVKIENIPNDLMKYKNTHLPIEEN